MSGRSRNRIRTPHLPAPPADEDAQGQNDGGISGTSPDFQPQATSTPLLEFERAGKRQGVRKHGAGGSIGVHNDVPEEVEAEEEPEGIMEEIKRKEEENTVKLATAQKRHQELLRGGKVDPLLKELYASCLAYFNFISHPLDSFKRIIHPALKDRKLEAALKLSLPDPPWEKRMQIQKLIGHFWSDFTKELKDVIQDSSETLKLYSIVYKKIGRMSLKALIDEKEAIQWSSFQLKQPVEPIEDGSQTPVNHDFNQIKTKILESLKLTEELTFIEGEANTHYFVHLKQEGDLGFFSIRKQPICTPSSRKQVRVGKPVTISFCLKLDSPFIYIVSKCVTSEVGDVFEEIMKVILHAVEYESYKKKNVNVKGLGKIIACGVTKPRVKRPHQGSIREQDKEQKDLLKDLGIHDANHIPGKRTRAEIAENIEELKTFAGGIGSAQDLQITSSVPGFKFTTLIKCKKKTTISDEIIRLYEDGIITNIDLYLDMMRKNTNILEK